MNPLLSHEQQYSSAHHHGGASSSSDTNTFLQDPPLVQRLRPGVIGMMSSQQSSKTLPPETQTQVDAKRRRSNLSILLDGNDRERQQEQQRQRAGSHSVLMTRTDPPLASNMTRPSSSRLRQQQQQLESSPPGSIPTILSPPPEDAVPPTSHRRWSSSKELRRLVVTTAVHNVESPYASMLRRKERIDDEMTERFQNLRQQQQEQQSAHPRDGSSSNCGKRNRNQARKTRRAKFQEVIASELTEIVTDLFLAESKLIKNTAPFVGCVGSDKDQDGSRPCRVEEVTSAVQSFIASLPPRYANGIETPSEVLLHMRLIAAVRSDPGRPTVHIANLADDSHWTATDQNTAQAKERKLVTICCADRAGLLEFISKILATGGSRVLDADVMLSSDNVALDRFVVEMNGRLRLDKLENRLVHFLHASSDSDLASKQLQRNSELSGTLYFQAEQNMGGIDQAGNDNGASIGALSILTNEPFLPLKRSFTLPLSTTSGSGLLDKATSSSVPKATFNIKESTSRNDSPSDTDKEIKSNDDKQSYMRQQRPLVNRPGYSILDGFGADETGGTEIPDGGIPIEMSQTEVRSIPFIPFPQLRLIETLGTGRVSTIYKAAWTGKASETASKATPDHCLLALKVAMADYETKDTSHMDDLRREADIAARLEHPNICHLVGVAEDSECFCLAYEYCQCGSLLSLLSDPNPKREYDFLPIALDICCGMAYLHSRQILHRDLKLSNVLITKEGRAKVSDFGMSAVLEAGQELTAETGTYR